MQGQYVEQVALQYTETEPAQYVTEQYVVQATNEQEAKVIFHFFHLFS